MIGRWHSGPNGKTITDFGTIFAITQNPPGANAHSGYSQWTTYQPATRYWHLQLIESGWLTLSLLLIGAAILIARRGVA